MEHELAEVDVVDIEVDELADILDDGSAAASSTQAEMYIID